MNFLAKILLFVFIFAQSAPSILTLIDSEKSISITMLEEEEKSKNEKEFKTEFIFEETKSHFVFNLEISNKINENYLIKDYQLVSFVDILPPEQV